MSSVLKLQLPAEVRDFRITERPHVRAVDANTEWAGAILMRAVKFAQPLSRRLSVRGTAGAYRAADLLRFAVGDTGREPVMALPGELADLEHALVPSPLRDLALPRKNPDQAEGQRALQLQLRELIVHGGGVFGGDQSRDDLAAASRLR